METRQNAIWHTHQLLKLAIYEWQLNATNENPDEDLFTEEQIDLGISFFGSDEIEQSKYVEFPPKPEKTTVSEVNPAFVDFLCTLILPIQKWFGGKSMKKFFHFALMEYWMVQRGRRSQYAAERFIQVALERYKTECRKEIGSHFVNSLS